MRLRRLCFERGVLKFASAPPPTCYNARLIALKYLPSKLDVWNKSKIPQIAPKSVGRRDEKGILFALFRRKLSHWLYCFQKTEESFRQCGMNIDGAFEHGVRCVGQNHRAEDLHGFAAFHSEYRSAEDAVCLSIDDDFH